MQRQRTVVLISGRGSNMMSLVEAANAADYPAEIVAVIANRPDAAGLGWAGARGIPTAVVDHTAFSDRAAFEGSLHLAIAGFRAEIVCLAGFMRVLTPNFVRLWLGRMLNIHPSLLPSFKGLHTHEQALAAGVRIAGCTVHFVVPEMDAGPILVQGAVPVLPEDTPDTLAARILPVEHLIYPQALALLASGAASMAGDRVVYGAVRPPVNQTPVVISPGPGAVG